MEISGEVSSGLGRAHVFMAQAHYQDQFRRVLGSTAWPGTLNVTVSGDDLARYVALRTKVGVDTPDLSLEIKSQSASIDLTNYEAWRIDGFNRDGVSFGGATAFKALISIHSRTIDCAVLIPDLTRHSNVVEVISGKFLREGLGIEDGDSVSLEVLS